MLLIAIEHKLQTHYQQTLRKSDSDNRIPLITITIDIVRHLDLPMDFSFLYLFDFGDELVHKVAVEKTREMKPEESGFPKLIDRIGHAPPQYGVFEEE